MAATINELDAAIFRAVHHALSGAWLWPMATLSAIGGGWSLCALMPVLLLRERTRRLGRSLAGVLAVTAVLVFVLKRIVARARPCNCLGDVHALVFQAPTDFSFPSGHAAGSFAFATFLALILLRWGERAGHDRGLAGAAIDDARGRLLRRAGAGLLLVFAFGVALSRIALAVHFPGDVLAGATLGISVASVGAGLHLRAERLRRMTTEQGAVSPLPTATASDGNRGIFG